MLGAISLMLLGVIVTILSFVFTRKSTDETEEKPYGHTVNHSDKQDKTKVSF